MLGLPKTTNGTYPELQIEVRVNSMTGRRSSTVSDEAPVWRLNELLPNLELSSIISILLYRHVAHSGRSMDIIMTTAQISMEVFDWGHNRLSVLLPIQDRIILCLEYTMSPSLDAKIVGKFVAKYNELAELQSQASFKLPPGIEDSPIQLLRTIFDSQNRVEFLKGFEDLRLCSDFLDQALYMMNPEDRLYKTVLHRLRRFCGQDASLPTSFRIHGVHLTKTEPMPNAGGGFGDVYRGRYKRRDVALKVIARNGSSIPSKSKVLKSFCREALIWKYLEHPNIAALLGVNVSLFPQTLCMVSPWMKNGSIRDYLHVNLRVNRLELLIDIAKGLEYLHRMSVIHGDIKGANVLVDDAGRACLSDFGMTTVTYDLDTVNSDATTTCGRGTLSYIAAEIFAAQMSLFGSPALLTMESDVYAFSMLTWEIFAGHHPFKDPQGEWIGDAVVSGKRPERLPHATALGLSDAVWGLMEASWQHQASERLKVPHILTCLVNEKIIYKPESFTPEEMEEAIKLFIDGPEAPDSTEVFTMTEVETKTVMSSQ
ncbi:hypothetical protein AcW1_010016 [Taiwanofungus camphoratus]|nr:hypothetical protein AcW1_010016 [Antrodia cinnamomea]